MFMKKNKIHTFLNLRKYRFKYTIFGGIVPKIILDLFLNEILENNKEKKSYDDPLILHCSANQGCFGTVDFEGNVYPCYFEFAPSLGSYYPNLDFNQKIIEKWNQTNFIIKNKFYKEPCNECKFFFLCNRRICHYHRFSLFDPKKKYCTDLEDSLKYFFDYYGNILYKKQ